MRSLRKKWWISYFPTLPKKPVSFNFKIGKTERLSSIPFTHLNPPCIGMKKKKYSILEDELIEKIDTRIPLVNMESELKQHRFGPIFELAKKNHDPTFYSILELGTHQELSEHLGEADLRENLNIYGKVRLR